MHLFTFYVGQGAFAVLVGDEEAIVIDAHMPSATDNDAIYLKEALANVVAERNVRGLILTSFDADHADVRTISWILNRYHPDWIMYPGYYKETHEADRVFQCIETYGRRDTLERISVRVDRDHRFLPRGLSSEWSFEALSPHADDMTNSNNSSLVLRVEPLGDADSGFSYLVTGDTEQERWRSIRSYFRNSLSVDVLAAPHHGSRNGIDRDTLAEVDPAHVLISAGIENQFGHPHEEALEMYDDADVDVYSTHEGESWVTYVDEDGDLVTEELDDWLEGA